MLKWNTNRLYSQHITLSNYFKVLYNNHYDNNTKFIPEELKELFKENFQWKLSINCLGLIGIHSKKFFKQQ